MTRHQEVDIVTSAVLSDPSNHNPSDQHLAPAVHLVKCHLGSDELSRLARLVLHHIPFQSGLNIQQTPTYATATPKHYTVNELVWIDSKSDCKPQSMDRVCTFDSSGIIFRVFSTTTQMKATGLQPTFPCPDSFKKRVQVGFGSVIDTRPPSINNNNTSHNQPMIEAISALSPGIKCCPNCGMAFNPTPELPFSRNATVHIETQHTSYTYQTSAEPASRRSLLARCRSQLSIFRKYCCTIHKRRWW